MTLPDATATSKSLANFRAATAAYLGDERFTDFTITCAGTDYKVHRCFISAHSRYFDKCCGGGFLEAGARRVELKDDDPIAVECMIHFFYLHNYDDLIHETPPTKDNRCLNRLQLNALVYATAEKYEVLSLKELAMEKMIKLSEDTCVGDDFEYMFAAIKTIYHDVLLPASARRLRSCILDMWVYGGKNLKNDITSNGIDLVQLSVQVPEFMAELAEKMLEESEN